jgi:hypothetical protein
MAVLLPGLSLGIEFLDESAAPGQPFAKAPIFALSHDLRLPNSGAVRFFTLSSCTTNGFNCS